MERDARSLPGAAQEALRRRAVRAVRSGKTQREVAALFGVSLRAVNKWVATARTGTVRALKARPQGRPVGAGKLAKEQGARIRRQVLDRCPDQLKLPFYLWTREAVAALIEREYGITVSVWTVGRYLKAWGLTPQKPLRRAWERDPVAVQAWLEEAYPAIRDRAKAERAQIYWGDEMGVRSDHSAGRSYGLKGRTPVIPGTGKRFGCNLISAITNRGRLNFMVFEERFRGPVFIRFLERLVRQADHKVYMIVDGHPVHRSAKVKRWLKGHTEQIELYFLPGYSPELNPDEMLNQDVKTNAVGRRRARNKPELIGQVRRYLFGRQRRPEIVRRYFNEPHVRYAAA